MHEMLAVVEHIEIEELVATINVEVVSRVYVQEMSLDIP